MFNTTRLLLFSIPWTTTKTCLSSLQGLKTILKRWRNPWNWCGSPVWSQDVSPQPWALHIFLLTITLDSFHGRFRRHSLLTSNPSSFLKSLPVISKFQSHLIISLQNPFTATNQRLMPALWQTYQRGYLPSPTPTPHKPNTLLNLPVIPESVRLFQLLLFKVGRCKSSLYLYLCKFRSMFFEIMFVGFLVHK